MARITPFLRRNDETGPKLTFETFTTADKPETFDGMPCSVQVATPTYRDEECLYAAKIIDQVLNGNREV